MNSKYTLNGFRKKRFVKIISVLIVQAFLFYGTGFASLEDVLPAPQEKPQIKEVSIDTIGLPKDIGTVKSPCTVKAQGHKRQAHNTHPGRPL